MVAIVTDSNEIIHDANIQIATDLAPTIRFLHRILTLINMEDNEINCNNTIEQ